MVIFYFYNIHVIDILYVVPVLSLYELVGLVCNTCTVLVN
jgi:hypothetical protein